MNYLKSFTCYNESYVLPDDIIQNIKDICLELNDMGFIVHTNQLGYNSMVGKNGYYPNLTIWRSDNAFFDIKEIEDVIDRIEDYMNSEGYMTSVNRVYGTFKPDEMKEVKLKFI